MEIWHKTLNLRQRPPIWNPSIIRWLRVQINSPKGQERPTVLLLKRIIWTPFQPPLPLLQVLWSNQAIQILMISAQGNHLRKILSEVQLLLQLKLDWHQQQSSNLLNLWRNHNNYISNDFKLQFGGNNIFVFSSTTYLLLCLFVIKFIFFNRFSFYYIKRNKYIFA